MKRLFSPTSSYRVKRDLGSDNSDANERRWKTDFASFPIFLPDTKSPSYLKLGKLVWNWREWTASERVQRETVRFIALPFPFSSQLKILVISRHSCAGAAKKCKKKEEKKAWCPCRVVVLPNVFLTFPLPSPSPSRKVPKDYSNNDGDGCENVT